MTHIGRSLYNMEYKCTECNEYLKKYTDLLLLSIIKIHDIE